MCRTFIGYPESVDNTHSAYLVVCSRMPRVYVRKTDKGQVPREVMERAIQAVKEGMPVRKAAKTYSIARTTLNNNLVKAKKDSTATLEPNYKHSQIFNQDQETSLANYLEKCSGMFHGLTTKNVRTLAYEMTFLNRIEVPATWIDNQIAGREWLFGFLRRHETLAIRQPAATSLDMATAFNRATVGAFFNNLHDCLEMIGASGDRISNLDETGVTTVQKVPKVVATKGLKQVGHDETFHHQCETTVFGPMKTHYNQLADSWMMRHVGKLITIYQIAELAGTALTKAATPENVISGFRVSGVWPFDRDIFSNVDYLPSDITDRSAPEDNRAVDIAPTVGPSCPLSTSGEDNRADDIAATVAQPRLLSTSGEDNHAVGEDNHAVDIAPTVYLLRSLSSSGGSIDTSLTAKASTSFSPPETFPGYPKAGPRSTSTKGRKRGRAMVAISTPEMAMIKKQHMVKMTVKQGSSKAVTDKTSRAKATAKTNKVKRTIIEAG